MPAEKAGPILERHITVSGHEVFLPVGCKLEPNYPADGTEEEKRAWLEAQEDCPPFAIDRDS